MSDVRLNIGGGPKMFPGYLNVDLNPQWADIEGSATSIPLPDGSVSEIMVIHLLEHLEFWDAPVAIAEWYRLLRTGGQLVLELPDIMKVCKNVVDGLAPKEGRRAIYGDPSSKDPLLMHRWGWTESEVVAMLLDAGFVSAVPGVPQYHGCRVHRDMRIVGHK